MDRLITVVGTGSASAVPDTVELNLGVRVQAAGAADALREASRRTGELISTLANAGVERHDIATVNISVWPMHGGGEHPRIVGYEAANQLRVRFRDVERSGAVIDAAAGAVGDAITIDSLRFMIDDPTELASIARRDAVQAAHRSATELASAAGAAVGPVRSISEGRDQPGVTPRGGARFAMAAEAVPMEAGTQAVTATVTITYELV